MVEEDEGPSKAWMESYADAMTLLLAFFIMMFAFALVDEQKFFDFKVGMVQAIGISDPINDDPSGMLFSGEGIAEVPGTLAISSEQVRELVNEADRQLGGGQGTGVEVSRQDAESLRRLLEQALAQLGAGEHTTVEIDERGVVIRFDDRVLFPSGSADLHGDGSTILTHVAAVLSPIDNLISVEGHTDDVPTTGTRWPTNWELSTGRATTVVRHLAERNRLPAPRLSATGHADTRPRASNASASGRRQNRRVEVVVLIEPTVPEPATTPATPGDPATPNEPTPPTPGTGDGIDPGIDPGLPRPGAQP